MLSTIHPSNVLNSRNALNEIILLHNKGILTDDEFTNLVRIISARVVESEIEKRIADVLSNAFANNPLFGDMLCPTTRL